MLLSDLLEIKEKELAARKKFTVRCCMAAGCMSSNAEGVKGGLTQAVQAAGLGDQVEVRGVGCLRLCCEGPLVQVDPSGTLFEKVTPQDAPSIIKSLQGAKTTARIGDPHSPFFTRQMSIVLENSGMIDPDRIEAYIAVD